MTTRLNGLVGQTPGATVTVANSAASGDAASTIVIGSGATMTYNATELAPGWPSIRVTTGATATGTYWQWSLGGIATVHFRQVLLISAWPPGNWDVIQLSGGSTIARTRITSAGKLSVVNGSTNLGHTVDTVPIGVPFVIESTFRLGASGTGALSAKFYTVGAEATADTTRSFTGVTTNLTSATILRFMVPITSGSPTSATFYLGALGWSDEAPIGPLSMPAVDTVLRPARAAASASRPLLVQVPIAPPTDLAVTPTERGALFAFTPPEGGADDYVLLTEEVIEDISSETITLGARAATLSGRPQLGHVTDTATLAARASARSGRPVGSHLVSAVLRGARAAGRSGRPQLAHQLGAVVLRAARATARTSRPTIAHVATLAISGAITAARSSVVVLGHVTALPVRGARAAARASRPLAGFVAAVVVPVTTRPARAAVHSSRPLLDAAALLLVRGARAAGRSAKPALGHAVAAGIRPARAAARSGRPRLAQQLGAVVVRAARAAARSSAPELGHVIGLTTRRARAAARAARPVGSHLVPAVVRGARAAARASRPRADFRTAVIVRGARAAAHAAAPGLGHLVDVVTRGARALASSSTPRPTGATPGYGNAAPERTLVVGPEVRAFVVPVSIVAEVTPEARVFVVLPDGPPGRILAVPAEQRSFIVT